MKNFDLLSDVYPYKTNDTNRHPIKKMSVERVSIKQKQMYSEIQRLKRQLREKDQIIYSQKRQIQNIKHNHSKQQQILNLQNTIILLKQELQFRVSQENQMQLHIQNYQLMNQKLRDQVQKLEKSLQKTNQNLEKYKKQENCNTSNTISSTPNNTTHRGKSPSLSNIQKQNHPLTPKSKFIRIPKQIQLQYSIKQIDQNTSNNYHRKSTLRQPKVYML